MRLFDARRPRGRIRAVWWIVMAVALVAGCGKSESTRRKAMQHVKAGEKAHYGGDAKKGLAAYNKAIQIDPECKDAYVRRGMLYNESGEPKKALADFTKAIQLDPEDSYPYEQRAGIYRNHFDDEAKAKSDEKKAFRLRQEERANMRKRPKGSEKER
jgi:tetratricopeptide (TPR) repeat protein